MSDQTLHTGYMAIAARAAQEKYQRRLGAVLLLEAAVAIALLLAPLGVSRMLGLGDDAGILWPRVAGLLLLILVAFMAAGRPMPASAKATNMIGFLARGLLGLLLIFNGGAFLLIGLIWIAAAAFLASTYFAYFKAEVMNRP